MSDFKIEMGVPVPPKQSGGAPGWVASLACAPVGASVFLPSMAPAKASAKVAHYGKGWATVRQVDGGIRVWKTAEPTKLPVRAEYIIAKAA